MPDMPNTETSVKEEYDLEAYCRQVAEQAKVASRELATVAGAQVDEWLELSASQLDDHHELIMRANQLDLENAGEYGLTTAQVDRLKLNQTRISSIADSLRSIAALDSPVGETFESKVRPNGLKISKVRVPLGVLFFIYESRPNVTADAAAIALKSRNAIILRGGKEAMYSSSAIVELLQGAARELGLPEHSVQLVSTTDRTAVDHFLRQDSLIDLAIPRGGESLIRRVVKQATMPVMKHFSGNCHVYIDQFADLDLALKITINSKCHRLGVCNAAESILVHESIAASFLPTLLSALHENQIHVFGDERVCQLDHLAELATEEDYRQEFLDAKVSVACVDDLRQAIDHINRFGSGHTDAIISNNIQSIDQFSDNVDTAVVMVNASTRFNDGGEFGLGAEIGISTDKFHARGPCGLKELTTYKYICVGQGQIRQ